MKAKMPSFFIFPKTFRNYIKSAVFDNYFKQ